MPRRELADVERAVANLETAKRRRIDSMRTAWAAGHSLEAIAKVAGLTRQRVHQLIR